MSYRIIFSRNKKKLSISRPKSKENTLETNSLDNKVKIITLPCAPMCQHLVLLRRDPFQRQCLGSILPRAFGREASRFLDELYFWMPSLK